MLLSFVPGENLIVKNSSSDKNESMKRIPVLFLILLPALFIPGSCSFRTQPKGVRGKQVEARVWSKVDGVVHYSGWKKYTTRTLDDLPGLTLIERPAMTKYGSHFTVREKATGFFYVKKIRDRWWIIDPEGYAGIHAAVNGVRPGPSVRNEKAMAEKFGTPDRWIATTLDSLNRLGFNGTACWSETPLIRQYNGQAQNPASYTLIWNLYTGYHKQRSKRIHDEVSFAVFDPAFAAFCREQSVKMLDTRNDPNLLGHFSDNELPFSSQILDEFLAINDTSDPNYQAARRWLTESGINRNELTDTIRGQFLGVVAEQYYKVVTTAIRTADPNHMYLGSRLHGKPKYNQAILKAAGKYADIVSVNYYGSWEPKQHHFDLWEQTAGKPVIITEFYTKGDDSGLPNISGAGWRVRTQEDRGLFYENFCLGLLEKKNCVGWHWFRYMDNDPTDTTSDPSNNDSNKGIVDNLYSFYQPLAEHMRRLNLNRYQVIEYLDSHGFTERKSLP
jgi:hypothetical protein